MAYYIVGVCLTIERGVGGIIDCIDFRCDLLGRDKDD
jgi:hypothetical protein